MDEQWDALCKVVQAQKDLISCPFCGCIDIWIFPDNSYRRFKAVCFGCSAQIYRGTLPELVLAWNKRVDKDVTYE